MRVRLNKKLVRVALNLGLKSIGEYCEFVLLIEERIKEKR